MQFFSTLTLREADSKLQMVRQEIAGGAAGTLGPLQGTLGGAINGPTGFVEGCIGGAIGDIGYTACAPVETAPANTAATQEAAGNLAGTLGAASAFLDSNGLCGGLAIGNNGFTTCLLPTTTS